MCPSNAFRYNGTLCSCIPGYLLNATTGACSLFRETAADRWQVNSGVDYTISFPTTIFDFDKIKKFTQSQAMFLEATVAMLISWLLFCFLVRFGSLGDGRTTWFRIRWWISRLDISFATRHWLVMPSLSLEKILGISHGDVLFFGNELPEVLIE